MRLPDEWRGPYWEPRDIWLGVYWTWGVSNGRFPGDEDVADRTEVYICLVPCFPIKLTWYYDEPGWSDRYGKRPHAGAYD